MAPFNILDYARTADQIAVMARELDALIKDGSGTLDSPALNRRMNDVNALVDRTRPALVASEPRRPAGRGD